MSWAACFVRSTKIGGRATPRKVLSRSRVTAATTIGAPETRARFAAIVGKAVSSPKNITSTLSSSFARGPRSIIRPTISFRRSAWSTWRTAPTGQELYVLVRAVRDKKIHEALVLELVGDDVERDLVRDPSAADLEVAEMHGHEDEAAPVLSRRSEVRPRARIDGHQPREVGRLEAGEPHDLDEVLREVAERPPRHARDLPVIRRKREHHGEVLLRDPSAAGPAQVCDLPADDRGRVGDPGGQPLRERGPDAPAPERRAVKHSVEHL